MYETNGLWCYAGSTFTKISQRSAYAITEDEKGNIWATGIVNPPDGKVWGLSCYDQKSLYNKNPKVMEIKSSGVQAFHGILEAIWLGSLGVECIVMMERPSRTLKVKRSSNNLYC